MSALILSATGFLGGAIIGTQVATETTQAFLNRLNASNLGSTAKKVTFVALHLSLALAAVGFCFAIPQMGLPFIATRVLQGIPLIPLLMYGSAIEQGTAKRPTWNSASEYVKWANETKFIALAAGIGLANYNIPMIATAAVVSLSRHVYSLMTC